MTLWYDQKEMRWEDVILSPWFLVDVVSTCELCRSWPPGWECEMQIWESEEDSRKSKDLSSGEESFIERKG
jgi:hypothetical protein